MPIYGTGDCPIDGDRLASLVSRDTGRLVFFCPLCGVAFRDVPEPGDTDGMVLRLDELAPEGVILATREQVDAAGIVDVDEMVGYWEKWLDEVLWQPPGAGEVDEGASRVKRWYEEPRPPAAHTQGVGGRLAVRAGRAFGRMWWTLNGSRRNH